MESVMIIKTIVKYWKPLLVFGLVLGVYFYWDHLVDTIKNQQKTIAQLTADNNTLTERITSQQTQFKSVISGQNATIEILQTTNKSNQHVLDTATKTVSTLHQVYQGEVQRILSGTKPVTCESAIKYLVDSASEVQHNKLEYSNTGVTTP